MANGVIDLALVDGDDWNAASVNSIEGYISHGGDFGAGAPSGTPSTGAGAVYYDTTNKRAYEYDGTGWVIMTEPSQSFTPTLVQSGAVTKTVAYAKYRRHNGWCQGAVSLAVTGTGTGGSAIFVGLPITAANMSFASLGSGEVVDISASLNYAATARWVTTTTIGFVSGSAANYLGGAVMTAALANGDSVFYNFNYEMTTRYS